MTPLKWQSRLKSDGDHGRTQLRSRSGPHRTVGSKIELPNSGRSTATQELASYSRSGSPRQMSSQLRAKLTCARIARDEHVRTALPLRVSKRRMTFNHPPDQASRYRGCLLGLAVGDHLYRALVPYCLATTESACILMFASTQHASLAKRLPYRVRVLRDYIKLPFFQLVHQALSERPVQQSFLLPRPVQAIQFLLLKQHFVALAYVPQKSYVNSPLAVY